MSGETFNRNQLRESAEIATEDWVRAITSGAPDRAATQFAQWQFH